MTVFPQYISAVPGQKPFASGRVAVLVCGGPPSREAEAAALSAGCATPPAAFSEGTEDVSRSPDADRSDESGDVTCDDEGADKGAGAVPGNPLSPSPSLDRSLSSSPDSSIPWFSTPPVSLL